jgi:hypothetical protein
MRIRLAVVMLVGCTGSDDKPREAPPPPPPIDAAAVVIDAPLEELELSDGGLVPVRKPREKRYLGIMLSSTPSGAIVAVDGRDVGRTPTYWEGEFTGGERCFSFRKAGHNTQTYRFVPVKDGFVHGSLDEGPDEADPCKPTPRDAGVPEAEGPRPPRRPTRPSPPPVDAAPALDAAPAAPPVDAAAPPPPDAT